MRNCFTKTMVLAVVACLLHSTPALGDLYLNGGLVYFSLPGDGFNQGGANEFDSFNTQNSDLFFDGVTGSPFQLVDGLNNFTVTGHAPSFYGGLGLFFTTNNVLLSQQQGRLPDLVVYYNNNNGFSFPNAGVQVATWGPFSGDAGYTGATNFAIDNRIVTVTAWDRTTLQLQVSAVPEPCSWALALISGMGISLVRVRRRP